MRHKRASPKGFETITDKELLELSELEAKATPEKMDCLVGDVCGGVACNGYELTESDIALLLALRNKAKELIRLSKIGKRTEDISKLNPLHPHFVNISNVAKQIIRQVNKEALKTGKAILEGKEGENV